MNSQSVRKASPAAPRIDVVMLPRTAIYKNPENKIYIIGDVSRLKADIAENGIRQPLEVIPTGKGKYMLIGGERRLTACTALAEAGDKRFARLPCIVRQSQGKLDDRIALITANATARELTDGERLDQFEAMKDALTKKKTEGLLEGSVREALKEKLGESSGGLGRLGAISANCTEEVKQMIRDGTCGITRAYEASKLSSRKQSCYAKTGREPYSRQLSAVQGNEVCQWLVCVGLAEKLKTADYSKNEYSYLQSEKGDAQIEETFLEMPGGWRVHLWNEYASCITAAEVAPDDPKDVIASSRFYLRDLYKKAKAMYQTAEDAEREKQEKVQTHKAADRARALQNEARAILDKPEQWPLNRKLADLGLAFYEYDLPDGRRIFAEVDTRKPSAGPGSADRVRYAMLLPAGKAYPGGFDWRGWHTFNNGYLVEAIAETLGEKGVCND